MEVLGLGRGSNKLNEHIKCGLVRAMYLVGVLNEQ